MTPSESTVCPSSQPLRLGAEDRVGDDAELSRIDAEALEPLAAALGVNDDAVEAGEQLAPERLLPCGAPRKEIVGGEDERPARAKQQRVCLGCGEPLEMEHIAISAEQARHPEGVLERLQRHPRPIRPDAGGEAIEALVQLVAVGRRSLPEPERRGDEVYLDPGARESRGQLVVVRRACTRVGRRARRASGVE